MKLEHRILKSIYFSKYLGENIRENKMIFVITEIKFDDLVKQIKCKPEKIYDTVQLMHAKGDVNFYEISGLISITKQGFIKLSNKSYLIEYQNKIKVKIKFIGKILGIIVAIIGIILGLSKIYDLL